MTSWKIQEEVITEHDILRSKENIADCVTTQMSHAQFINILDSGKDKFVVE